MYTLLPTSQLQLYNITRSGFVSTAMDINKAGHLKVNYITSKIDTSLRRKTELKKILFIKDANVILPGAHCWHDVPVKLAGHEQFSANFDCCSVVARFDVEANSTWWITNLEIPVALMWMLSCFTDVKICWNLHVDILVIALCS